MAAGGRNREGIEMGWGFRDRVSIKPIGGVSVYRRKNQRYTGVRGRGTWGGVGCVCWCVGVLFWSGGQPSPRQAPAAGCLAHEVCWCMVWGGGYTNRSQERLIWRQHDAEGMDNPLAILLKSSSDVAYFDKRFKAPNSANGSTSIAMYDKRVSMKRLAGWLKFPHVETVSSKRCNYVVFASQLCRFAIKTSGFMGFVSATARLFGGYDNTRG